MSTSVGAGRDPEAFPSRSLAAVGGWRERLARLAQRRAAQFWVLQTLGWSGWALITIVSGFYWSASPVWNLVVLWGAAAGMVLTLGLRHLYRALWEHPIAVRAVALLAGSLLVAAVWQALKNVALFELYYPVEDKTHGATVWAYVDGTRLSLYVILCWSGLYFGIKYYRMLLVERERALAARSSAREAQLKMLRYQLNPHFLFNTLNAISTLILVEENETANRMVSRLSSFLRYSLDSDPMQKVDLEQEVRALMLFLDIEQVRFEERLTFQVDIEPEARAALVPSLLLQPLVENAIKHGIARSERGGTIRVAAHVEGRTLELAVEDDGPGLAEREAPTPGGVGLRNTRERLAQVYGAAHSVTFESVEPHGLRVVIRIPFETGARR